VWIKGYFKWTNGRMDISYFISFHNRDRDYITYTDDSVYLSCLKAPADLLEKKNFTDLKKVAEDSRI